MCWVELRQDLLRIQQEKSVQPEARRPLSPGRPQLAEGLALSRGYYYYFYYFYYLYFNKILKITKDCCSFALIRWVTLTSRSFLGKTVP